MVSPVHGDYRRCQAEIPLIVLCRFPEPALASFVQAERFRFQREPTDKIEGVVVMTAILQTLFRTFHSVSDIDVLKESPCSAEPGYWFPCLR
jgi:hypothetical protein